MKKWMPLFASVLLGCAKLDTPTPIMPKVPAPDCFTIVDKQAQMVAGSDVFKFFGDTVSYAVTGSEYLRYKVGDIYCPR